MHVGFLLEHAMQIIAMFLVLMMAVTALFILRARRASTTARIFCTAMYSVMLLTACVVHGDDAIGALVAPPLMLLMTLVV